MISKDDKSLFNVLTCDVIYSDEEREYFRAIDDYKRINKRPHPTLRELLAVAVSMGYRKTEPAEPPPVFKKRQGGFLTHEERTGGTDAR